MIKFFKRHKRSLFISMSLLVGIGIAAFGYAYLIEPDRLVVNKKTILIKNWNRAFDGLRIVMIADIHGGSNSIDGAKIRKIVKLSNDQDPDLVVLLGDFVSESSFDKARLKMPLDQMADSLKGLRSRLGVFAVLGNHDVWYDAAAVKEALKGIGYTVLEHETVTIEKNGQKLRILGLKDHTLVRKWKTYSEDAKEALKQVEAEGDLMVLEHSPDMIRLVTGRLAISDDLKLFLAAHTHGGQVWFPLIGSPIVPSSYGQRYNYGHIRERGVDMFVTTGIGTSILPVRFLVPPEIVVLTVRSG